MDDISINVHGLKKTINSICCLKIKRSNSFRWVRMFVTDASVCCPKLSPDRSATMQRDGPEKRKIKVPLSRRESALAVGTISLERSRSKTATRGKRGERKKGNCRVSFHLINFIACISRKRAADYASVLWRGLLWRDVRKKGSESIVPINLSRSSDRPGGDNQRKKNRAAASLTLKRPGCLRAYRSFTRIIGIAPAAWRGFSACCTARQYENAPFTRILARECRWKTYDEPEER